MGTTNITVSSITITSEQPPQVALVYSNGTGNVTELSQGTICYSMATTIPSQWSFVGITPCNGSGSSDITVTSTGRTMTLNDAYTVVPESFDFTIQVSNGSKTYSSPDPEIINKPPV